MITGDEVTDHPALMQAKLTDRMTTATKDRIEPLRTAYQVARVGGLGSPADRAL